MVKFCSLVAVILWYIVEANCQDCSGHPPMMMVVSDCCKINVDGKVVECFKKIGEKWNEFRQSSNKDTFDMSDMCASNCFLNNDIFTSDNKINSDEVKSVLEKILGSEWESLLPNVIETCKDRVDNHPNNGNGTHGHKGPTANCNMASEKLFFCLREQIMMHCPDSLWINGDECNSARSYMKNCPHEKRGGQRGQQ